jgi:hypothetical protein
VGDDDRFPGSGWAWIGWDEAGTVERIGDEAIETAFFHVVIPIRAGKSFYRYRTSDGAEAAIEIRRHRASVLAGFLRTPLWLAAAIVGAPCVFAYEKWGHLVPIVAGLAALAAAVTLGIGRLGREERERRALLRRVLGVGVPPELLPDAMRDDTRETLADGWFRQHHIDWRDAIAAGTGSEHLVALAEYYQVPGLVDRAWRNLYAAEGN